MTEARDERDRSNQRTQSTGRRWMVTGIGLALWLIIPTAPSSVEATPFTTAPSKELQINCPAAVMTKAPTFLTNPKGSARYPFQMQCTNAVGPGVLYLYFEGRWNPSETRQDMPNAVETLVIENYSPHFISGRQQRGPGVDPGIFVYWTARRDQTGCLRNRRDPRRPAGACQGGTTDGALAREAWYAQRIHQADHRTSDTWSVG